MTVGSIDAVRVEGGVGHAPRLRPVAGFEATDYAWFGARLVWAGQGASGGAGGEACAVEHPRSLHRPWWPPAPAGDAPALRRGARIAMQALAELPRRGLLLWLAGEALAFPLQRAHTRLDALRLALDSNDVQALAAAAPHVLGLGPGLTPSGDDFLGGIFFALAHAPRCGWAAPLAALKRELRRACTHATHPATQPATNPISAALLSDLMDGIGYRVLHDWLAALETGERVAIVSAAHELLRLGASSGADLMSGVLITLASTPEAATPPVPTISTALRSQTAAP